MRVGQTDRETDSQTDRETDRDRQTDRDRDRDRQTSRPSERQVYFSDRKLFFVHALTKVKRAFHLQEFPSNSPPFSFEVI